MTSFYTSLLTDNFNFTLCETRAEYKYLTERHIQAIWYEQILFTNLRTHDGEAIIIISPGIWNSDAGPDFLKAHLKIGDKEYRGDVEVHLQAEGWYQHHHHTDPRY